LLLLVTLAGGGALDSTAFLLLAPLRGSGQTRPEGLVRGFQGCALLIAGVLVLRLTNSQAATALAFPVVGIASVAFTVKMAIAAFGIARPRWDAGWLRQSLRPAVPIFASTLIFFLYFRVDAYLLAYLKGSAATGTYGAAYNLAFGVTFIPLMFGRAVMPRIAAANGPAPLRDAIRPSVAVSAALGVGLAVLLGAVTPVIPIAYGPSFDGATQPYVLLIVAQALFCISHVCAITLVARERGVALWGATLVALAVNVTANLALIPRLGAAGAALAMVISETAFLSTLAWFVRSLVLQPTAAAAGLPARPAPVSPREAA
jgi:O-antigen/teichoic acid export membrane protein